MNPQDVLHFWFEEATPEQLFEKDMAFDAQIRARFGETHAAAARGELASLRATPEGRLAEIIVLDQFSRQLHRGSPEAFAQDKMAVALAQEAIAAGADAAIAMDRRMFLFMPFMHAESLVIQEEGCKHFAQFGEELMKFMTGHRDCIARFGRFPFRNKALGRVSTPEELAYMEEQKDRVF